jgi:hypothetical protein
MGCLATDGAAPDIWRYGDSVWIPLRGLGGSYTSRTGRRPYLLTAEEGKQSPWNLPKLVFLTEVELEGLQAYVIEQGIHSSSAPAGLPLIGTIALVCPGAPAYVVETLLAGERALHGNFADYFIATIGKDTYEEVVSLLSL